MKTSSKRDAAATFKALLARAENDEQLMKSLKELESALEGVADDADGSGERSRLPYSSDPPICDNVWN